MYKLTPELITALQSTQQTQDKAPSIAVDIYKKDGIGGHNVAMPYSVGKDIADINISISNNTGSNDCTITLNNNDARYSPDYSKNKTYRGIKKELPLSIYKDVITPNNLVHIYMGYGEHLVRKFTGYIANPQIDEKSQTIKFHVKDEYSKLQKSIDPLDYQRLVYRDARASFIIGDLLKRAGIEKYVIDTATIEGKDYSIPEYAVDVGTNYDTAIKKLLDLMNHSMKADRFGVIQVKENHIPDANERPDIELSDYINITDGQYYLDDALIRNKIVVQGHKHWKAYRDKGLLDYFNQEEVLMSVNAPWAITEEKMKEVANYYFMQMRRKYRTMTVCAIANPCMDCGDTASLEAWVSTAKAKYVVASIETSMSEGAFRDTIELEYILTDVQIAEEAEGKYAPYELEIGESGETAEVHVENAESVLSIQEKIINTAKGYIDVWYQANGDRYQRGDYGFDSSRFIFACLNTNGILAAYQSLPDLLAAGTKITEDELALSDIIFILNENGYPTNAAIYVGGNHAIGMFNGSPDIIAEGKARSRNARCMKVNYKESPPEGLAFRRF